MLYCKNCGYVIGQNDNYCGVCGKPQGQTALSIGGLSIKFPMKSSTNFCNGFIVGMGLILMFVGLMAGFWLNGRYWYQQANLLAAGFSLKDANDVLFDTAFIIPYCILIGIMGVYMLIYGLTLQLSPTMNSLVRNRLYRANWGFGLISGSIIFFTSGFSDIMYNFYGLKNHLYPISYAFVIAGIILNIIGVLLIVNAYRKSRRAITKV